MRTVNQFFYTASVILRRYCARVHIDVIIVLQYMHWHCSIVKLHLVIGCTRTFQQFLLCT